MKIFESSKGLFTLAFILLFLTNGIILLGVYINKTEITSHLSLTQRELQLPYISKKENTGVSLHILFRTLNADKSESSYYKSPAWLNAEKLNVLGFNTEVSLNPKKSKNKEEKELFIVLEYDGASYQTSLALAKEKFAKIELLSNMQKNNNRLEGAKKELEREESLESRLFAIDAGLDYEMLRSIYSNKSKYLITKGVIQLGYKYKSAEPFGRIQKLAIERIYLPYRFKHLVQDDTKAKYSVEVNYGSRYEPWIVSVEKGLHP